MTSQRSSVRAKHPLDNTKGRPLEFFYIRVFWRELFAHGVCKIIWRENESPIAAEYRTVLILADSKERRVTDVLTFPDFIIFYNMVWKTMVHLLVWEKCYTNNSICENKEEIPIESDEVKM